MPTKRNRGSSWEFIIKNKKLLNGKPYTRTFKTEAEGDAVCAILEAQLAMGIVPLEMQDHGIRYVTVEDLVRHYMQEQTVSEDDRKNLNILIARVGATRIDAVNYTWAEEWIKEMKIVLNNAPSTIRHHVGALARCFDWGSAHGVSQLVSNPLRKLPKKYAQYTDFITAAAIAYNPKHKKRGDVERERRLESFEEVAALKVLEGFKREDRQRGLDLEYQGALKLIFTLGIESAMRLREMYTITLDQISMEKRTVFLDKTKNGDKRQVPLSTTAVAAIEEYIRWVEQGKYKMEGFLFEDGKLFPWWNGNLTPRYLNNLSSRLSNQFGRIFDQAGCADLRFHDLRHEGTSRLFEKTTMSEFEIMKITGHSDTKMLKRYANLRATDLAAKMW
jgi:integrase